jgi:hypothetical protein
VENTKVDLIKVMNKMVVTRAWGGFGRDGVKLINEY